MTNETARDRILKLIKLLADDNNSRFAKMLDLYPSNIDVWVNKNSIPSGEHLQKFHDKLNININWLLTGDGEMFNKKKLAEYAAAGVEPHAVVGDVMTEYGFDKEKREYVHKLLHIFQDKEESAIIAIKSSIDAFIKTPDRKKDAVKKTKAG